MSEKEDIMLTTKDNPFDPFENFDEWFRFDEDHGYHSCSLLARVAKTSSFLPDEINDSLIDDAIHEIVELNASGMHAIAHRKT